MFWSILSKDRLCSFSVTLMRKHRLLWRCQLPWPHPHPLIQTTRKVWRGKGKKLKGKAVPMHSLHDAVFYSPLGSVWHGGNNLVLYPHFTAHNCSLIHLFFHPQFKIYKFHILHFQNLKIFCFLRIFCLWFFFNTVGMNCLPCYSEMTRLLRELWHWEQPKSFAPKYVLAPFCAVVNFLWLSIWESKKHYSTLLGRLISCTPCGLIDLPSDWLRHHQKRCKRN